jgi:hypothetical protein
VVYIAIRIAAQCALMRETPERFGQVVTVVQLLLPAHAAAQTDGYAGPTAAPTRLSLMPHDSIADATLPARKIFAGTLIAFRPIERGCLGARL